MRVLADDYNDAMNFINQIVAKERGRGMKLSEWMYLREEAEDRSWMDFTGFDITY